MQNGCDKNMVLVNDEQDSGTDEFLAGNISSDDLVPEQGSGKEIIPETKVIETVGISETKDDAVSTSLLPGIIG